MPNNGGVLRVYTLAEGEAICKFFATPADSWREKVKYEKRYKDEGLDLETGWVDIDLDPKDEVNFEGVVRTLHPTREAPELIRFGVRRVIVTMLNLYMGDTKYD
jgi:hypothetical protein